MIRFGRFWWLELKKIRRGKLQLIKLSYSSYWFHISTNTIDNKTFSVLFNRTNHKFVPFFRQYLRAVKKGTDFFCNKKMTKRTTETKNNKFWTEDSCSQQISAWHKIIDKKCEKGVNRITKEWKTTKGKLFISKGNLLMTSQFRL